jgi:hypothetical protein
MWLLARALMHGSGFSMPASFQAAVQAALLGDRAAVPGLSIRLLQIWYGVSCSTPRRCGGSTPLLFLVRVLGTSWYWARGVFYW